MKGYLFCIILLNFISFSICKVKIIKPKKVNIGVFLTEGDKLSEIALNSSINLSNLYMMTEYEVIPHIYRIKKNDVFETGKYLCDMLEKGITAIFGPDNQDRSEIIQSVSSSLEIPQFQTFWSTKLASFASEYLAGKQSEQNDKQIHVFNIYPNPLSIAKALSTLVRENDWKSYTIIYENDDGLVRLQEVLKDRNPNDPPVKFKKLGSGPDYRTVLKEVKSSGELQIILDCQTDHIIDILLQAKEVKLLEDFHSFILTSLDAHTLDWRALQDVNSNVTAIRILDPDPHSNTTNAKSLLYVIRDWELHEKNQGRHIRISPSEITTKTALLYDAMSMFMSAYKMLDQTQHLTEVPLSCTGNNISEHGYSLSSFIQLQGLRKGQSKGQHPGPLTGQIFLDKYGQRTKIELQIIEKYKDQATFRLTGSWDSTKPDKIRYLISSEERERESKKILQGMNLRVVSRLGAPYLMLRESEDAIPLAGNARFEGYAMDVVDGICAVLNCTYSFELVPDGMHGSYDPKKGWNGLIKHLLDRKAELAICDLTITYERRKAVDFTMPFMTLGISILYAKTVKEPPDLLAFTNPLSLDTWLYMATAYLLLSIIIFLAARLHPQEWENPHPCDPAPAELENIWDIKNCCWLTLGSIMNQGCDILPKGASTRMVASMWWFFSLIMTSCYTANLAAFLTMDRMGPTIDSAEDLAGQTKIKYGCLEGGSTASFFRDTNFSDYHKMWVQMESAYPSVFEKTNSDGVKRVLTSKNKYAFLMESSSIEYEMERNCDLIQVGSLLDSKGYGIAMPTNAFYRKDLNEAILKMQEMGTLHKIKEKWWKEMHGGGQCAADKESTEATATELGLPHVGGVFVVLGGGVFISLVIAVCEFLWNVRKVAVTEHMTLQEAFKTELKFALNIWVSKKKVRTHSADNMSLDEVTKVDKVDKKRPSNSVDFSESKPEKPAPFGFKL